MSDECIHGFVDGLCATCNPKPVPEAPVAVKAVARSRTTALPRATVRSLRAAARIPVGVSPSDTILEQRIYHLTHIRNLPGIVAAGAIVANASPVMGLGSAQLRTERSEISVTGADGKTVAAFVPFFLSPDARLWQALRDHEAHPRLSAEAVAAETSDFIFLVSSVRHVVATRQDFVVTDGPVEGTHTRFVAAREDADRLLYRLRLDSTGDAILDAELLVADEFPLESVTLVGVQNDKVRAAVREILLGSDFTPKVSVYPPWFQPA